MINRRPLTEVGELLLRGAAARNAGDEVTYQRCLARIKELKPEWAEEDVPEE